MMTIPTLLSQFATENVSSSPSSSPNLDPRSSTQEGVQNLFPRIRTVKVAAGPGHSSESPSPFSPDPSPLPQAAFYPNAPTSTSHSTTVVSSTVNTFPPNNRPPTPPQESIENRLRAFLSDRSLCDHVPKLLEESSSIDERIRLIKILATVHDSESLQVIVKNDGVRILRKWLMNGLQLAEAGKEDGDTSVISTAMGLIGSLIPVLQKLPVSLQVLSDSGIVKALKRLVSANAGLPPSIINTASNLLKTWKSEFAQATEKKSTETKPSLSERKRSTDADSSSSKRSKIEAVSTKSVSDDKKKAVSSSGFFKSLTSEPDSLTAEPVSSTGASIMSLPRIKKESASSTANVSVNVPSETLALAGSTVSSSMAAEPTDTEVEMELSSGSAIPPTPAARALVQSPVPDPYMDNLVIKSYRKSESDTPPEPKKKKKSVRWKDDKHLCQIRYFETPRPEDYYSPEQNVQPQNQFRLQNPRDMDRAEAARAFQAMREELQPTMEWYYPKGIAGARPRTIPKSQEVLEQTEREKQVLSVMYFRPEDIPPHPAEPEDQPYEPEDDSSVRILPFDDPLKPAPFVLPQAQPQVTPGQGTQQLVSTIALLQQLQQTQQQQSLANLLGGASQPGNANTSFNLLNALSILSAAQQQQQVASPTIPSLGQPGPMSVSPPRNQVPQQPAQGGSLVSTLLSFARTNSPPVTAPGVAPLPPKQILMQQHMPPQSLYRPFPSRDHPQPFVSHPAPPPHHPGRGGRGHHAGPYERPPSAGRGRGQGRAGIPNVRPPQEAQYGYPQHTQPPHQNQGLPHQPGALPQRPRRGSKSSTVCPFWARGNCRYGTSCRNLHENP